MSWGITEALDEMNQHQAEIERIINAVTELGYEVSLDFGEWTARPKQGTSQPSSTLGEGNK
jgi:hypothetical protein